MVGAKVLSLSLLLASAFAAPSIGKRGNDGAQGGEWKGQAPGKPLSGLSVSDSMPISVGG